MIGRFVRHAAAFLKREDGPTAAEYAVMLALIIAVIVAVSNIGNTTSESYSNPALQKAVQPAGS